MKLKFSAAVKRDVNMSSTAWEKGPCRVKSFVRSLVGSCNWSFWQSSSGGGTVKHSEQWCPSLSGEPPLSSPYILPPPPLASQASDHCFSEPLFNDFFFHGPHALKIAYGVAFIK